MTNLFKWTIFEVKSSQDLQGIKFRGRLRKFAISQNLNLLVENTEDNKHSVRFAILDEHAESLMAASLEYFIKSIYEDASIVPISSGIQNPVLSKIAINDESRYQI